MAGGGVAGGGAVCGLRDASRWRPKSAYRHTVEDTVYLSPGCTGRGIGSALLGTLPAGCAAAGAWQVIAVIADTGSDASAALHRRFGFTQAGLLSGVGRKHGRWIDTLLMQKGTGVREPDPMSTAFSAGERNWQARLGKLRTWYARRWWRGNWSGSSRPRPFGSLISAAGRGPSSSGWPGAGMT